MVKMAKYTFRDENATELNKKLEEILHKLEGYKAGLDEEMLLLIEDCTFLDLLDNYQDCCSFLEMNIIRKVIAPIIDDLSDALYSNVEWIPFEENDELEKTNQKKIQPYLRGKKAIVWVAQEVKPLILKGITKQDDVAKILGINATTIQNRVKNGYRMSWKELVEYVNEGVI